MSIIVALFNGLPEQVKLLLIAAVLSYAVQLIKKVPAVAKWLDTTGVGTAKAAKFLTVVLFSAIATAVQWTGDWQAALTVFVSQTSYAIALHEGWQKLILNWFVKRNG